jgi:hypothetical protein
MWKVWMLIVLCLVACGQKSGSKDDDKGGDKPSSKALEAAVFKALKKEGLIKFTTRCGVMFGPPTKLDTVEVVEWGEANPKEGYIPAKISVSGTCSAGVATVRRRQEPPVPAAAGAVQDDEADYVPVEEG